MKAFVELTHAGKVRRLRGLARQAVDLYPIRPLGLSLLKSSWNTTFRVETKAGQRYALRISKPGVRDLSAIRSELIWLDALARETDILVPKPIRSREGELVEVIQFPGVPGPRFVSLFEWIGGRRVDRRPSQHVVELLGERIAQLHNHAETFKPPAQFTKARWDCIGTFSGTPPAWVAGAGANAAGLISGARRVLFERETERVEAELDRLFANGQKPLFLHFDMHLGNVKLVKEKLAVLDFDDSLWGYPVQDVALSIYYLRYMRGFHHNLEEALKRRYCRLREWPEEWPGQLNLLLEARALDMADVLISLDHPAIASRLPELIQGIEDQLLELRGRQ